MQAHVFRGTKQEIVENLTRISGEVCEAIVFVEEPTAGEMPGSAPVSNDIFADMRPYMVNVNDVDDSREAVYTRIEGE